MTPNEVRPRPVLGAAMLAIGRGEGIALFGGTVRAYMSSLLPLALFALAGAALMAAGGVGHDAAAMLGSALVTLLAPAVLSHALARRWDREEQWLRYATAVNWCQWVQVAAATAMLVVLGGRLQPVDLVQTTVVAVGLYGLWLNWVTARAGLELARGRAALLVLLVNGGTLLLVLLPEVLGGQG